LPRLESGSGFLPDVGTIGLSFSKGPRSPGLITGGCSVDAGVPFSRSSGSAADRSGGNSSTRLTKTPSATVKRRQPFTCLKRQEEPETKNPKDREQPPRTPSAYFHAAPKSRNRLQKEKMPRGRRKSLKRLDPRKRNAWISFRFPWISFRPGFDFLPEKFGYPSSGWRVGRGLGFRGMQTGALSSEQEQ
jgi:hypothetical protein